MRKGRRGIRLGGEYLYATPLLIVLLTCRSHSGRQKKGKGNDENDRGEHKTDSLHDSLLENRDRHFPILIGTTVAPPCTFNWAVVRLATWKVKRDHAGTVNLPEKKTEIGSGPGFCIIWLLHHFEPQAESGSSCDRTQKRTGSAVKHV
jgi:hypothetical protein